MEYADFPVRLPIEDTSIENLNEAKARLYTALVVLGEEPQIAIFEDQVELEHLH